MENTIGKIPRGSFRLGITYFLLKAQFWFPIWVIFLMDRGFSLSQIVIADVIFRVTMTVLEFPLGVIGDQIGRKKTYFLGAFFSIITYISLILVSTFYSLILCWFIWAIFLCFISGTDTAYRYELLITDMTKKRSVFIFGVFNAIGASALIISHLSAGKLYSFHPNLPILLNAVFSLIAAVVILTLPEVQHGEKSTVHPPSLKIIITDALTLLRRNRKVLVFVIILAIWTAYHWTVTLLFQPLLKEMNIPINMFGIVFVSFTGLGILSGFIADYLNKKTNPALLIIGSIIIQVSSMAVTGFVRYTIFPILGIVFLSFAFYLSEPVLNILLNQEIDNTIRASLISLVNLLSSVIMILSRPLVGIIADKVNVYFAFEIWFYVGLFLGGGCIIQLYYLWRKNEVVIR